MTTVGGYTPLGDVTTTNRPTFNWVTVGNPQTAFEIRVFRDTQYNAVGFDPATSAPTFSSGQVPSAVSQYTMPSGLVNGGYYRAYIRVAEGTVGNYIWSSWGGGNSIIDFRILLYISDFTNPTPVNNANLTTSRPLLGGTVNSAMPGNVRMRREWQFSQASNFTTSVITVTEDALSVIPQGSYPFAPLPSRLQTGVWYMRARTIDEYGNVGNWSGTNVLNVSHPPSAAALSPAGGNSVPYGAGTVNISWTFTDPDPDDFQSLYQVTIWPTNNLALMATYSELTPPQATDNYTVTVPIPGSIDQQHTWVLEVADQDMILSAATVQQTFTPRASGTVTILSPTNNGTVATPSPTIQWSFSGSGGRVQSQYRVDIQTSGVTVASSGWLNGTNTSWTPSSTVVQPSTNYTVTVSVVDSFGLQATSTHAFTASFTQPPGSNFSVDNIYFADTGGMLIDWSGSQTSSGFVEWRIYRRIQGASNWSLVGRAPLGVNNFSDYTCPSGTNVEYAVVQARTDPTFGTVVESARTPVLASGQTTHYFIVVPDDPDLNLLVDHVTADSYEEEYEQETINLIGRGRRHETGTRFGVMGNLSATFYDDLTMTARGKKIRLDNIRASRKRSFLRTPFGDVWAVAIPSLRYDRISGVGTREFLKVDLSYTEVTSFDTVATASAGTTAPTQRTINLNGYTNPDSFHTPTVSGGALASPTVSLNAYADPDTVHSPTVALGGGSISLDSHTDSDTFPTLTIAAGSGGGTPTFQSIAPTSNKSGDFIFETIAGGTFDESRALVAGDRLLSNPALANFVVSQWQGSVFEDSPTFGSRQGYLEFPTSALGPGTVTSPAVKLHLAFDFSDTDFLIELYAYNFGDTVDEFDMRTTTQVGALTLLATLNTNGIGAIGELKTMTVINQSALIAAISTTGPTRFILVNSNWRNNVQPGLDVTQSVTLTKANCRLEFTFTPS